MLMSAISRFRRTFLSGWLALGATTAPSFAADREGVILLHGLCRSASSMKKMEDSLTAAGYTVANIDYPSRTATVHQLAEQVLGAALADSRLKKCRRIHFVTHSLGGILVRDYFFHHQDAKLGRVVMLGPPNQGSEVVDHLRGWWIFKKLNGPAGQELGTDRDSAPNRLGPVHFPCFVIAGNRSINWVNSLMIPGADDGKVSVARTHVPGEDRHLELPVCHPFMMKDERVIREVLKFLKNSRSEPVLQE
jgi:triacylglycerol lipase